jgi:hypothetical protein
MSIRLVFSEAYSLENFLFLGSLKERQNVSFMDFFQQTHWYLNAHGGHQVSTPCFWDISGGGIAASIVWRHYLKSANQIL